MPIKNQESNSLENIKIQLMHRKKDIEKELIELYQEKFTDGSVQDAGDEAASNTMESLRSSMHESIKEEYDRIINALGMIDLGTYGICIDCELPISEKRLHSFPNATRCITCQSRAEEDLF